jgi:hypothetical protein
MPLPSELQMIENITFLLQGQTGTGVKSSSLLGCLMGESALVLKLGIHPEMERSAILNRSMPSTAGVTISPCLAICSLWLRDPVTQSISRPRKLTLSRRSIPDGRPFLQDFSGRFLCFTLISYMVPQNRSKSHPIYQVL